MKKRFVIFTIIFNLIYITLVVLFVGNFLPKTHIPGSYYLFWVGGQIIIFVGSFLQVFYFMTKYHKFEFGVIRTQLLAYFSLQMVTLLSTFIKLKFFYSEVHIGSLKQLSKACDENEETMRAGYWV